MLAADEHREPYAAERLMERVRALARLELEAVRDTPAYKAEVKRRIIEGFHEKQRAAWTALEAGTRYVSLCCSRRAGKTHFLASLIVLLLLDATFGQDVVFVAPTLKRGKELIWRELERLIDAYHLGYKLTRNQGTVQTEAGAFFRIVGLDNKRQVGKVARGGNTRAFLADESQEFAHLLRQLIEAASPALAQSKGVFIGSGTPGYVRRGYWFEIGHGAEGFLPVHWTLYDNPYLGRDPGEILAEEKARNGWDDRHPTLLREFYGLWVDDETRMVCELSDALNVVDQAPEYDARTWKHFLGVDYGNDPDPCAWVVAASHPHKNYVAILHAEKRGRLTSDAICSRTNELRTLFGVKRIVGDSASGGKTFIQDFNVRYARAAGFSMLGAEKHDRRGSIDMVNTELRTGRLVMLREAAKPLIDEMRELQWNEERTEFLPGEDHCFAAGTPVLTARGEVPIERVRLDDMVLTRRGFRQVVDAWCSAIRVTVTITFDNGAELTATPDHPVWTPAGWRDFGTLEAGDPVVCLSPRPSNTEATFIAAIQSRGTGRFGPTSTGWFGTVASAARSICTVLFGRRFEAPSLPSITFTTSTETRSITGFPTSLASVASSIFPSMRWRRNTLSSSARTSGAPSLRHPNGIALQKDEPGTASTASAHGKAASLSRCHALVAGLGSLALSPAYPSFAATSAKQQREEHPASTTSRGHARYASASSRSTDTHEPALALARVVAVAPGPSQPVYDLMVEGEHEFFAAGVLVHNCYDALRYVLRATRGYLARPAEVAKTAEQKELARVIARNRHNEREREALYD